MAEDQKLACNRVPFETTSSCDRGHVDIYTFSDLPICNIIDPPLPDFGQPTVDFPVVPFQPPPCACININTDATGKVTNRDDVKIDFGFGASGDCCEGNYHQNIDIEVPCVPFELKGGNSSHDITIHMSDCAGSMSPTGTINLGLSVESCTIKVNPKVVINIPKPPTYDFDTELSINTICGLDEATASFTMSDIGDSCEHDIVARLNLQIPKPEKYSFKTELNLETVCGISSAIGSITTSDVGDSCEHEILSKLTLKVPKIHQFNFKTDLKMKKVCRLEDVKPDIEGNSDAKTGIFGAYWVEDNEEDCKHDIISHLDLEIPCIMFNVTGASTTKDIEISENCATQNATGTVNLGLTYDSCCTLKFDPVVKLNLPKAKEYDFSYKFNKIIGPGVTPNAEFKIEEQSSDACTKKIVTTFNIAMPTIPHIANLRICGAGGGGAGTLQGSGLNLPNWDLPDWDLKGHSNKVLMLGKLGGSGSLDLGASLDSFGYATSICPTLTLNLPCPLDNLHISKGSDGEDSHIHLDVKKEEDKDTESSCAARWSISLKKPKTFTGAIKVLTGIRFNGTSFETITRTLNYKDGLCTSYDGDSPFVDIPVSKHVNKCCNDEAGYYDHDNGDAADGY